MVIVTEGGQELEAKVRLARIGYDRVVGWCDVADLEKSPLSVRQGSRLTAKTLCSAMNLLRACRLWTFGMTASLSWAQFLVP
jgi:hypothetical protein